VGIGVGLSVGGGGGVEVSVTVGVAVCIATPVAIDAAIAVAKTDVASALGSVVGVAGVPGEHAPSSNTAANKENTLRRDIVRFTP
jgi:hypothetical protein